VSLAKPILTQETPTEPGLYWFTLAEGAMLRHCRVMEIDGVLRLAVRNAGEGGPNKAVAQLPHRFWAGPLPEPDYPDV